MAAMHHELQVKSSPAEVANAAATFVSAAAVAAIAADGEFRFAVSGGHTPWEMFSELRLLEVQWPKVKIYQVDERFAPSGDDDRNLTHLEASLQGTRVNVIPMGVEVDPSDEKATAEAAADYEQELPDDFHLVHLGLGPDGHTASLVPDDPILEVTDRLVGCTDLYQGRRRMTLTYPALALARQLLWLVTGSQKADALQMLLSGNRSIPAGRVSASGSLVIADSEAAV